MSTLIDQRAPLPTPRRLEIAFPAPDDALTQDKEWVVVRTDQGWKKIRLHDYDAVYAVPGLYERWVYDILKCGSPAKIRELMAKALDAEQVSPGSLCVLDLGAGTGIVAEELSTIGAERFVGIDIHDEAAESAERDRPGLYSDYVIDDLTDLTPDSKARLDSHEFNCLTCVAALGFGDIPTEVFAAAFNRIVDGGWIAFTIKNDFLDVADDSGFAELIRDMQTKGTLEEVEREAYVHRITTDGEELIYDAFVGRKRGNISV